MTAGVWRGLSPEQRLQACYFACRNMSLNLLSTCLGPGNEPLLLRPGSCPLHVVAASDKPEATEAVRILLQAMPRLAQQKDGRKRLPLHHVLEAAGPSMSKTCALLLQAAPETVKGPKDSMTDCYENTPLFLAMQLATRPRPPTGVIEVTKALLALNPGAPSHVAQFNKLPLHLVAPGVTSTSLKVAQLVHDAYPDAARSKDRIGNYPHKYASTKEMRAQLLANHADNSHGRV